MLATDRQTDRPSHHNTSPPLQGQSKDRSMRDGWSGTYTVGVRHHHDLVGVGQKTE